MKDPSLAEFSEQVGRATPVPAGGSVAAVVAALSAALVLMVARIGQGKRHRPGDQRLAEMAEAAERLRQRLLQLAEEDATAYARVLQAKREAAETSPGHVAAAWVGAAQTPAEVVKACGAITQLARRAVQEGPASTIGDAVTAALLAAAAAAGSLLNLRLNSQAAGRPVELRVLEDRMAEVLQEAQRAAIEARQAAEDRLAGL